VTNVIDAAKTNVPSEESEAARNLRVHAAVNGALGVTRVLLDLDPVIVEIGPFAIRWYGC